MFSASRGVAGQHSGRSASSSNSFSFRSLAIVSIFLVGQAVSWGEEQRQSGVNVPQSDIDKMLAVWGGEVDAVKLITVRYRYILIEPRDFLPVNRDAIRKAMLAFSSNEAGFLDSFLVALVRDPQAQLKRSTNVTLLTDGDNRRVIMEFASGSKYDYLVDDQGVVLSNASQSHSQQSIFQKGGFHFRIHSVADFFPAPLKGFSSFLAEHKVTMREAGGSLAELTAYFNGNSDKIVRTVDRANGVIIEELAFRNFAPEGMAVWDIYTERIRASLREVSPGVWFPRVCFLARYQENSAPGFIELRLVESVDIPASQPKGTFSPTYRANDVIYDARVKPPKVFRTPESGDNVREVSPKGPSVKPGNAKDRVELRYIYLVPLIGLLCAIAYSRMRTRPASKGESNNSQNTPPKS